MLDVSENKKIANLKLEIEEMGLMGIRSRKTLFAFAILTGFAPLSFAAFKTTDVIYENKFNANEIKSKLLPGFQEILPSAGEKGDGVLWLKNPNYKINNNFSLVLDPKLFQDGGFYVVEAKYRGENLKKGDRFYFGPNIYFRYSLASQPKKTYWNGSEIQLGSPNWTHYYHVEKIPKNEVVEIGITINNRKCSGEFFIDTIRISKAVEVPDNQMTAPKNEAAAKIVRGRNIYDLNSIKSYHGPITAYRGFQVHPNKVKTEDIKELGSWNVNLIRFCFSGKEKFKTTDDFLRWTRGRIERLDQLMPELRKQGIKVVICFAAVPGGEKTNYASINLTKDFRFEALEKAWQMVAEHYKNNSQIYGYDLLNEPYSINSSVWHKIAEKLIKTIRTVDASVSIIDPFTDYVYNDRNVIYSPHIYAPHALTHQGVRVREVPWRYPGYINGTYWDKEQLRVHLLPVIEFQRKNKVKIYIGEFSCVAWAVGRDRYIQDCVELFEEYGWDWTYHAFREWAPWSVEHERMDKFKIQKAKFDTSAKKILVHQFKNNKK